MVFLVFSGQLCYDRAKVFIKDITVTSTKVSNLNASDIVPHLRLFLIVTYYTAQNKTIQMCKLDLPLPVLTFFLCRLIVLLWLIVNNSVVLFV